MQTSNLSHIRQKRPRISQNVMSILQDEANIFGHLVYPWHIRAEMFPNDALNFTSGHHGMHQVSQRVKAKVLHLKHY